jgi:putative membrane protein
MFHPLAARTLFALLLLSPGFASGATHVALLDRAFMERAARSGNAEIEIGDLAARKATLEEVRNLGLRIVEDHTRLADELRQLASLKGVTLPRGVAAAQAAEIARLRGLSGPPFDLECARFMVKEHERNVRAFRREARSGRDADVVRFASHALPVLEDHLARARSAAVAARALALTWK